MRDVAKDNANAQVLVRAIKFSIGAQWDISQPTDIENFTWDDLLAYCVTDMGSFAKVPGRPVMAAWQIWVAASRRKKRNLYG